MRRTRCTLQRVFEKHGEKAMRAGDVMTRNVATVAPDTTVDKIVDAMMTRHISAVPVVDAAGRVVGIVSEGDLVRRQELGTDKHPSWWLRLISAPEDRAHDYLKAHGVHAKDVMTKDVATVSADTDLSEVADLLEDKRIKRVPVVEDGKLVGIVSRADLIRGLAAHKAPLPAPTKNDAELRAAIEKEIGIEIGAGSYSTNVIVSDGTVHLWGAVESAEVKEAMKVAAERVAGEGKVVDRLAILSATYTSGWV